MEKRLKVKGMSCGHCTAMVEKNLSKLPGVTEVKADLGSGIVIVKGEPDAGVWSSDICILSEFRDPKFTFYRSLEHQHISAH